MKKKIFTLLTLLLCVCSGAWAQTTYTYTGYTGEIAKQFTHNYGDTYVGRIGNSFTPVDGGLPTGNSNIFAAFQVTKSSKIKVVFVWTKTDGDLSGKSIALATIDKTKFDKLALASTSAESSVKYSDVSFTTSQTKAVAINRSKANVEVEFEFDVAVGEGYYAVYTASSINASALIKKIVVTPTYELTFANATGASGVAPAAMSNASGTITLPKNTSMWYADGYSLTKWVDESDNEYNPGSEYTVTGNQTLTAKFEENTVNLNDRTLATTIKWGPFTQNLGVPAININGTTGFVVAQATVSGKTIDVQLPIDATASGAKFVNQLDNNWTQVNPGIKFTIPTVDGATVSYKQYDNGSTTTPEATATGNTYDLTLTGTSGQLYIEYIQVVLPGPTYTVSTTLTNVTKTSGDATVMGGTEYTATFAAADGYALPTSVEVSAGGSDITANCTWTKATGTLTIPAAYVTGNIAITIEGVAVAGTTMIKAVLQSSSNATITGTVQGTYSANSDVYSRDNTKGGCKLGQNGAWVCITLASGWTFKAGDIVNVNIGTAGSGGTFAFYKESTGTNAILTTTEGPTAGLHTFVLPATANNEASLYLVRKTGSNFNPYVDYIEVIRPNSTVTLNASGFATYSAGNDFTYLGADAYTMALDMSKRTLTGSNITAGTKIPAGAGILFKGTAGAKVSIMNTTGAEDLAGTNNLHGTTDADGNTVAVPAGKTLFVLSGDTFKPYNGTTFAANKAFFQVNGTTVEARSFTMTFDDETTGINAVENTKPEVKDNVYYNLNGQRVMNPGKGLYIVNGKKVFIK